MCHMCDMGEIDDFPKVGNCPHCKSAPGVYWEGRQHWVACADCGMRGPIMATIREAIEAWNSLSNVGAELLSACELGGGTMNGPELLRRTAELAEAAGAPMLAHCLRVKGMAERQAIDKYKGSNPE